MRDDALDAAMSFLAHPTWRTRAFTMIEGRRLVSEWLEIQGQSHGFSRVLGEQLSPGQLRAEIELQP
jgi:hypothetical protein